MDGIGQVEAAVVSEGENVSGRSEVIARLEDATEEAMPGPGRSADGEIDSAATTNEAEAGNGQPPPVAEDEVATFNQMPDLVMLKIFSFFNPYERKSIELVSQRWLQMSRSSLKSVRDFDIDLSRFETLIPVNPDSYSATLKFDKCGFWWLERLATTTNENEAEAGNGHPLSVATVNRHRQPTWAPDSVMLTFDNVGFVRFVNAIRERLTNLKTLTLSRLTSHAGISRFIAEPHILEKYEDCFTLVGTSFPNLESLLVSMPRSWLPFRCSWPLTSERFQSLRHLKLKIPAIRAPVSSTPLSLKLKSFPVLVTIDVFVSTTGVNISCDAAAPSLKKFRLSGAVSLPRGSLVALVDCCPELEDFEIDVRCMEDKEDIVELRRLKLKRLSLELWFVDSLPTSFCSIFYGQSRLESLYLYPFGLSDDKEEILRIVRHECKNLRDVYIE